MSLKHAGDTKSVISVSRRTDIPRWYSRWLGAALRAGRVAVTSPYGATRQVVLEPDEVHTLVLWSKDFSHLLSDLWVVEALARYDQTFCHFTVTGLGGSALEPGVPPWAKALDQLPRLLDLCGDPRRVVVRFDPIVHWKENGLVRSNLPFAEPIFRACAREGIPKVKVSFATLYGKALRRRFAGYDPTPEERTTIARNLWDLARSLGIELQACSDPSWEKVGVPRAACIAGRLLSDLHPQSLPASTRKDRGQRALCLCTESVDIGSYWMRCPGGCLYCYANPLVQGGQGPEDGGWA